ncbi:phosphotransferase [Mycobacterium sp. EPG1]|nr:phosphotransferase [Mycobacterium sp. EPG1]
MTPEDLAERTRRATDAAVAAGRELGLRIEQPTVLHDVFSVVVHLRPQPVVARIPVVSTANLQPDRQNARQQRELDVAAWLDAHGVPVVPPSARVPRRPVRRDGFAMTFWELADVAEDHEPYRGVDLSYSVTLHEALRDYPAELPFLSPFNDGLPEMIAALRPQRGLTTSDIERARAEFDRLRAVLADRESFHRAFAGVPVQPVQGDAPSHNVIRTRAGILFSDFEDITCGPVEWDLAMLGEEAITAYDRAAHERGLRRTDPEVLRAMESARRLQFVGCFTLIPQLPILAAPLIEALDEWRATPEFG